MNTKTITIFFLITIIFIGGCQTGSDDNNGNDPISVNMTFTLYNNMTGQLGSFSQSVTSGTNFKLNLTEIISQFGVINVDPSRFVLRETSSVEDNGNQKIGDYVADSVKQGTPGVITINVPKESVIKYDIFLVSNLLLSEDILDVLDKNLPKSIQYGRTNFITAKLQNWGESSGPEYIFKDPDNPGLGIFAQVNESFSRNWKNDTIGRKKFLFGHIDYKGETSETVDMEVGYDNSNHLMLSWSHDWFTLDSLNYYGNPISDIILRTYSLVGALKVFYINDEIDFGGALPKGMIWQGFITPKGDEINAYYTAMLDNIGN